jgi:hypothetical protein
LFDVRRRITYSQGGNKNPAYSKERKDTLIGLIEHKNCFLKHVIEGKVEGMGLQAKRRKQLLNDRKKMRECWELEEEALDRFLLRAHFERDYGAELSHTP